MTHCSSGSYTFYIKYSRASNSFFLGFETKPIATSDGNQIWSVTRIVIAVATTPRAWSTTPDFGMPYNRDWITAGRLLSGFPMLESVEFLCGRSLPEGAFQQGLSRVYWLLPEDVRKKVRAQHSTHVADSRDLALDVFGVRR